MYELRVPDGLNPNGQPRERQIDGVARESSTGALSDIIEAKFRETFPVYTSTQQAYKDIDLLEGSYKGRGRWKHAPQFIVASAEAPENIKPLDLANNIIPYAESKNVEVYHVATRRLADWVYNIPDFVAHTSQYQGKHYFLARSVSQRFWYTLTVGDIHIPAPWWKSRSGDTEEIVYECTTASDNVPAP